MQHPAAPSPLLVERPDSHTVLKFHSITDEPALESDLDGQASEEEPA